MSSSPPKANQALANARYDAAPPTPPPTSPVRPSHGVRAKVTQDSVTPPDALSSPSPNSHQSLPNVYNQPLRCGIWPTVTFSNTSDAPTPSPMIDGAQFSGGQTFQDLQKLGLAMKSGSATSQSARVAELAKKVAIREYEDPRRTPAAKEARREHDGRRRHNKLRKKAAQLEALVPEAVDVRKSDHSSKKKRRVLPWLMIPKRMAPAAQKANSQIVEGKRRSSSINSIEVEEAEDEVAVYFNEI